MAISLKGGWAVVKDTRAHTHILLVPTRRVSGIEDPRLLAPHAPNDWRRAWQARRYLKQLAQRDVPRQDIGLVVNSEFGRTQNQLHIHIDCVWPQVADALAARADQIGPAWAAFPTPLSGGLFEARRLMGADLTVNPFKLLARGEPAARGDMGAFTLAVVGMVFEGGEPGFVLLAHRADLLHGDRGNGESLLDHDCLVLRRG
jgi:CDP-diacylglycerol pyrophosphatase